jgi:enterochelin esterase-like enzyme
VKLPSLGWRLRPLHRLCSCLLSLVALALPARAELHGFELDAPEAKAVFYAGEITQWDQHMLPMQRGADGKWRLAVDLGPGQWLYKFVVDGRWIADPGPADRDADGQGGEHSFVFIGPGDWQDRPAIPKGHLDTLMLPSKVLGQAIKLNVYLPPGFARGKPMPVLWLLHGWGMDADQWARTGKVERYMNNLIARRAIRPFVVVMPSVPSVPGSAGSSPYSSDGERFLTQELPAWLRRTDGLHVDRRRSAVAGMSWGGTGAFHLAMSHPRQYGLAVAQSGYFSDGYIAALPGTAPLPMELQLLCGRDDELVESNRKLVAALRARGAIFSYREDAGAHTWQYWSHRMTEMLVTADAHFNRPTR